MRPIAHTVDQAMPDRIEMDVVDVSLKIPIVTDCVLPEATLPQRRFSVPVSRDRCSRFHDAGRETPFDETPTVRVIGVAIREGHHNVQVVRQDHDRIDRERMRVARPSHGRTQGIDVIGQRV